MSTILIVLALFSLIVLPAISMGSLPYLFGAAAFVALASIVRRIAIARRSMRAHPLEWRTS